MVLRDWPTCIKPVGVSCHLANEACDPPEKGWVERSTLVQQAKQILRYINSTDLWLQLDFSFWKLVLISESSTIMAFSRQFSEGWEEQGSMD